jgi:very-short-patch-repair endonuclease
MIIPEKVKQMVAYLGKTRQFLLHLDAPEIHFSRARNLRRSMTEAEKVLWGYLQNRKAGGYKFRRQHPLGSYIADFYCHEKRLVVEVDGEIHLNPETVEKDENRTAVLERYGIAVIRFSNQEVLEDTESVVQSIIQELNIR